MAKAKKTRTPAEKAAQKARTEKNKQKPPKKRQFASELVKKEKLKIKELKRKKYEQSIANKK